MRRWRADSPWGQVHGFEPGLRVQALPSGTSATSAHWLGGVTRDRCPICRTRMQIAAGLDLTQFPDASEFVGASHLQVPTCVRCSPAIFFRMKGASLQVLGHDGGQDGFGRRPYPGFPWKERTPAGMLPVPDEVPWLLSQRFCEERELAPEEEALIREWTDFPNGWSHTHLHQLGGRFFRLQDATLTCKTCDLEMLDIGVFHDDFHRGLPLTEPPCPEGCTCYGGRDLQVVLHVCETCKLLATLVELT